jgi:predicted dehydrogenase
VHVESYWSYDLGDVSYVGPLLGNPDHWVRRLPGGLLHNIISHGIARLAEFLDDDLTELVARAHQSEQLREMGGHEVVDELRVLIRDGRGTTATFCFSTQMKPGLNQLRIFGPRNSITVDLVAGSVVAHQGRSYKSYLTYVVPSLLSAKSHLSNAWRNLVGILRGRIYQDAGMKDLIERFHRSVADGGAPPIPYREVLLTARIMDEVFDGMCPTDAQGRRASATTAPVAETV